MPKLIARLRVRAAPATSLRLGRARILTFQRPEAIFGSLLHFTGCRRSEAMSPVVRPEVRMSRGLARSGMQRGWIAKTLNVESHSPPFAEPHASTTVFAAAERITRS